LKQDAHERQQNADEFKKLKENMEEILVRPRFVGGYRSVSIV